MIKKRFKIIACIDQANGLGKDGGLLYNIGNDKSNFVSMTMGNVVIMGRKTYESIGHPLDGRINIILTSNEDYAIQECDNAFIVHTINDVIELCEAFFYDREWFVIGGSEVYRSFLESDLVCEMRLTVVNDTKEADTFFPNFNKDEWYIYYKSMAQTSSWKDVDRSFYFEILKKEC